MIAIDTSVLALAVNRHAPGHARVAGVVEGLANGERPWALPWPAVYEFLRFVTHPHAVARPLSPGDAAAFLERLLASPSVSPIGPAGRHAEAVLGILAQEPRGEIPHGLELAAVLREHGVRELLSTDRGMQRHRFLTVIDPLSERGWSAEAHPVRRYRVLARPRA